MFPSNEPRYHHRADEGNGHNADSQGNDPLNREGQSLRESTGYSVDVPLTPAKPLSSTEQEQAQANKKSILTQTAYAIAGLLGLGGIAYGVWQSAELSIAAVYTANPIARYAAVLVPAGITVYAVIGRETVRDFLSLFGKPRE